MAKAFAKQENWVYAMREAKLADNRLNYSIAFMENRLLFIRNNFEWLFFGILIGVIILVRLLMFLYKLEKRIY